LATGRALAGSNSVFNFLEAVGDIGWLDFQSAFDFQGSLRCFRHGKPPILMRILSEKMGRKVHYYEVLPGAFGIVGCGGEAELTQ